MKGNRRSGEMESCEVLCVLLLLRSSSRTGRLLFYKGLVGVLSPETDEAAPRDFPYP